jgi:hypothetical protein
MTWDVRSRDIQDESQLWRTVDFSDADTPLAAVEEVFGAEGVMISTTATRRFRVTRKPDEILDVVTVWSDEPPGAAWPAVPALAGAAAFDPPGPTEFEEALWRRGDPAPPEDPPGPLTGWQIALWFVVVTYALFGVFAVWRMLI